MPATRPSQANLIHLRHAADRHPADPLILGPGSAAGRVDEGADPGIAGQLKPQADLLICPDRRGRADAHSSGGHIDDVADDDTGLAPHIPALDGNGLLLKVVAAMGPPLHLDAFAFDSLANGCRRDH